MIFYPRRDLCFESQKPSRKHPGRREKSRASEKIYHFRWLEDAMMRRFVLKFCQPKSDPIISMSRSLSRVRNLISEIEEIQRQGQQGGRSALERTMSFKSDEVVKASVQAPVQPLTPPVTPVQTAPIVESVAPVAQMVPPPKAEAVSQAAPVTPTPDPFLGLDDVVSFDAKNSGPEIESVQAGKVFMQLTGHVALQLQIEDSDEVLALQQIGNMLEIRFPDGKAFHIPIHSVA